MSTTSTTCTDKKIHLPTPKAHTNLYFFTMCVFFHFSSQSSRSAVWANCLCNVNVLYNFVDSILFDKNHVVDAPCPDSSVVNANRKTAQQHKHFLYDAYWKLYYFKEKELQLSLQQYKVHTIVLIKIISNNNISMIVNKNLHTTPTAFNFVLYYF